MDEQNERDEDIAEIREMLEHQAKLLEQNNRIIRKMQRSMRRGLILKVFYWALIIGSMFGLYYYLQPYINTMTGAYEELIAIPDKLKLWE